jgi:ubiquinone biosynthesis protein UbiJ
MFRSLQESVESAVMERATLLVNHVLAAETAAVERLRAHSGSSLRVEFIGWPQLLPAPPLLAFRITPAGLVEWLGDERSVEADLRIDVDASNPALAFAQALGGIKPKVDVAGSAAFAADVDWLIANLRWDIQDDLARVVGAAPAHQLGRLARAAAAGLRAAVRTVGGLVAKGAASPPAAPGEPPPR